MIRNVATWMHHTSKHLSQRLVEDQKENRRIKSFIVKDLIPQQT
jgi:hypothetical protein